MALPAPSTPPEHVVDPAELDRHPGSYDDVWNVGDVVITREADDLYIDMPLLTQYGYDVTPKLAALSSDIFFVTIDGEQLDLTFIPTEPDGPSQYIRNRLFVATRAAEPGPAGARHAAANRDRLDDLLLRARLTPSPRPDRGASHRPLPFPFAAGRP